MKREVISADVEARLLGVRLLTLRADISVAPDWVAAGRSPGLHRAVVRVSDGHPRPRIGGAAPGGGLAAAARALESGADDLRTARDQEV